MTRLDIGIDWRRIRPIRGNRSDGFEELCCQLARLEIPPGSYFERKGVPDGGVECFSEVADGQEWGWQAKYVFEFGNSQISELDRSIRRALTTHPQLTKYFVCLPIDLADPRLQGKEFATDRWKKWVAKWKAEAKKEGRDLEIIRWGSFELNDKLVDESNRGRLRYFFDTNIFDEDWFLSQVRGALGTAGPRYTPELNVELPLGRKLEAIARTQAFVDSIKSDFRPAKKSIARLKVPKRSSEEENETRRSLTELHGKILSSFQDLLDDARDLESHPSHDLGVSDLADLSSVVYGKVDRFEQLILQAARVDDQSSEGASKQGGTNPYHDALSYVYAAQRELISLEEKLRNAHELCSTHEVILRGNAGTGKTHLLCDFASECAKSGRPTILLMGQQFTVAANPWSQATEMLQLRGMSPDEFVGAMEAAAEAANSRALFIVDALNEGAGRDIWPNHIVSFLDRIRRSQWIVTIMSIRTTFEDALLPDVVRARAVQITHMVSLVWSTKLRALTSLIMDWSGHRRLP